jgi:predicted nucleic acid-binding protein
LTSYALDANVILRWLFPAESVLIDDFMDSLTDEDELLGALVLIPECTAVLRSEVFDRRLRHEEAQSLLDRLLTLPLHLSESRNQFVRALDLAHRFQHRKAYDMQYLAVAEMEGADLVTTDRGLRHAAQEIGVPVRFLQ